MPFEAAGLVIKIRFTERMFAKIDVDKTFFDYEEQEGIVFRKAQLCSNYWLHAALLRLGLRSYNAKHKLKRISKKNWEGGGWWVLQQTADLDTQKVAQKIA